MLPLVTDSSSPHCSSSTLCPPCNGPPLRIDVSHDWTAQVRRCVFHPVRSTETEQHHIHQGMGMRGSGHGPGLYDPLLQTCTPMQGNSLETGRLLTFVLPPVGHDRFKTARIGAWPMSPMLRSRGGLRRRQSSEATVDAYPCASSSHEPLQVTPFR